MHKTVVGRIDFRRQEIRIMQNHARVKQIRLRIEADHPDVWEHIVRTRTNTGDKWLNVYIELERLLVLGKAMFGITAHGERT